MIENGKIFKDQNIILTGATGGVGTEVAKELYKAGANLLLISKSRDKLENLRKSLTCDEEKYNKVRYLAADFNNLKEVEQVVPKITQIFKQINVLINNAGIGYHGKIATIDINEMEEVFNVNVLSPILLTSRLLPILKTGHIINLSSILGSRAMEFTAVYTASKHALTGFTKVLRKETAEQKICVTVIEPGAIDTTFIKRTHDHDACRHFSKRKLKKISAKEIAGWVIKIIDSDSSTSPELIRIMPQEQII